MSILINKVEQLTGHTSAVYALCEGPSPGIFLSGSSDGVVAEWDVFNLKQGKIAVKINAAVYSIAFVKEKKILLIGNGIGGIHIVNLQQKKEIKLLQIHKGPVFDIKYSAVNNCFYSASSDGTIAFTELENYSIQTQKICEQKVRQLHLNQSQTLLAVASGDCTIRIFNTQLFKQEKVFPAHDLSTNAVSFHPNGKQLVTGGRDAFIKVWDIMNDYTLQLAIPAHNFAVYAIGFNADKNLMATASRDKTVKIWDASTFELLKRLDSKSSKGHLNSVNCLMWHQESGKLLSAGDDRSIIVWEILKG